MAVVSDQVPLVLVTGASGFIATHLVQQLLSQGRVKVRGTVRSLKNEEKVKPLFNLVADARYPLELVEADLTNQESWVEAVKGCTYVYHVASPFPSSTYRDENVVIKPAVEGTLNVLKAVVGAGTVKRVVLTSSVAAISGLGGNRNFTEEDWSPVEEDIGAYQKSKTLAEKAAWDFLKELEEDKKFELVAVNPALVIGPLLNPSSRDSTSTATVLKLLNNEIPALVDVTFNLVDVRDVAAAHIAAMEVPEAAGNRHLLVGTNVSMKEISDIISNEFKPQGYRVPSFTMPKFGVWIYKAFDPAARLVYPLIGRVSTYSNERMQNVLNIRSRKIAESILDTCYNLIELGIVPKKAAYRGPPRAEPETLADGQQLAQANGTKGEVQEEEEEEDSESHQQQGNELRGEVETEEQQPDKHEEHVEQSTQATIQEDTEQQHQPEEEEKVVKDEEDKQ